MFWLTTLVYIWCCTVVNNHLSVICLIFLTKCSNCLITNVREMSIYHHCTPIYINLVSMWRPFNFFKTITSFSNHLFLLRLIWQANFFWRSTTDLRNIYWWDKSYLHVIYCSNHTECKTAIYSIVIETRYFRLFII